MFQMLKILAHSQIAVQDMIDQPVMQHVRYFPVNLLFNINVDCAEMINHCLQFFDQILVLVMMRIGIREWTARFAEIDCRY